jgi:hypothetical protein
VPFGWNPSTTGANFDVASVPFNNKFGKWPWPDILSQADLAADTRYATSHERALS